MRHALSYEIGIASIGVSLPSLGMDVRRLAALRGVDPDKYTIGLGCREMALTAEATEVVTMGAEAARRALARWGGAWPDVGLLAVGTETALDMSRPLSAFIAAELGLAGRVRSYEVKHACYGGTLALRQALEWAWSGAGDGRAALVIATDVSRYAEGDPGEPTQGAGAVAMIVSRPDVAAVDRASHAFAKPAFDFWRPVGEAYPRVDGPLSLDCYREAAGECFAAFVGDRDPRAALDALTRACFHVPFPKMVRKAVAHVGERFGWDSAVTAAFFEQKVAPTMRWNERVGNAYTAALWLSVASALAGAHAGERMAAFSYGSGYGAELFGLTAGPRAAEGAWAEDVEHDLARRTMLDEQGYLRLLNGGRATRT